MTKRVDLAGGKDTVAEQQHERTYHVGLAVAGLDGLFQPSLHEALQGSWVPSTSVTRYGRTWHLARMHTATQTAVTGQIGFVSEAGTQSMRFDHDESDFVSRAMPGGTRVPFAVRLRDGLVAYQLRPGLVSEVSFTGALEALLTAPGHEYIWQIRQAVEWRSWPQWRSSLQRVSGYSFRLERHGGVDPRNAVLAELLHDAGLDYLRLAGRSSEREVNTAGQLFRAALQHVLDDGGRASVHGVTHQGEDTTWVKEQGEPSSVTSRLKVVEVGAPEISEADLLAVLERELPMDGATDLTGWSEDAAS